MIWAKTEAGRREIQSRVRVPSRPQRTLLLLIDGVKSDASLLASVAGVSAADFEALQAMGLIAPVAAAPAALPEGPRAPRPDAGPGSALGAPSRAEDQRALSAALTELIPTQLGMRGFTLTLAVEKAGSIDELRTVAERTIEAIARRRGDAAAADARRTLFGR